MKKDTRKAIPNFTFIRVAHSTHNKEALYQLQCHVNISNNSWFWMSFFLSIRLQENRKSLQITIIGMVYVPLIISAAPFCCKPTEIRPYFPNLSDNLKSDYIPKLSPVHRSTLVHSFKFFTRYITSCCITQCVNDLSV